MRGFAHHFYSVTYRAQAFVGFAIVAWMIGNVPGALAREQYIGTPLTVAVVTGVVSIALVWPYLTPTWIAHPTRLNQLIPLTLAHLMFPLLYAFVGVSAMVVAQLDAPVANQMAAAMAIFLIATSAVCIGLGMSLCFTRRKAVSAFHEPIDNVSVLVPVKEAQMPEELPASAYPEFQTTRERRVSRVG